MKISKESEVQARRMRFYFEKSLRTGKLLSINAEIRKTSLKVM